ncbi:MAG: hypothetical protein OEL55_02145 [Desulfobulbaceae bacterium]|nr:hypothetical protein [Desulfobulbaceae bacterium]
MPTTTIISPKPGVPAQCFGYCQHCKKNHELAQGNSQEAAQALMAELEKKGRIDLQAADQEADPNLSLDYLYGPALGQMFGVLEYRTPDGDQGVLRAFSGQYNGNWQVEGWAPPLFSEEQWQETNYDTERQIKAIGGRIEQLATNDPQRQKLIQERKTISQQLMKDLHGIYRLTNFRGETKPLKDVFPGQGGIPTGTGDCCAPKLLNYAARHELIPVGISEFYIGHPNRSKTKQHGKFYPSCAGKCQPILGFLLCGLEE